MGSRRFRLLVLPVILFVAVSGTVLTLALLHPAKPEAKAGTVSGAATPAARGQALFEQKCTTCHETGVGPDLNGASISIDAARTQIQNGGGGMPANLVSGQELEDVLAYLQTILG
ncbi:MAG TPA: cytochrome c [Gaiellaceae bacterium]|nr:cytochrome c [Gaiellaceae bacterium]